MTFLSISLLTYLIFNKTWLSILVFLLMANFYPDIVAHLVPGTIAMPPMDNQCFCGSKGVFVNYMNCNMYDSENMDILVDRFKEVMTFIPKLRYKIKEIAGDYYYEEMSIEETISKIFIGPESDDKILRSLDDIN